MALVESLTQPGRAILDHVPVAAHSAGELKGLLGEESHGFGGVREIEVRTCASEAQPDGAT